MINRKMSQQTYQVKQTQLCRYARPTIITHKHGNEFFGHSFKNNIIEDKYRIKAKCATRDNTQ